MQYTRAGSGVAALAGATYLTSSMIGTAAVLACGAMAIIVLGVRRRRRDRSAARRGT